MKKVLLGTLAVLTLAACSKDEVIQQNPNDAISFSVTTNKAISRAAEGYCNKSLPGDFQVWAEVDGKNYFAQERYTKSGDTYVISGAERYWPESSTQKINFYAACNKGVDDGGNVVQSNIAIDGWTNETTTTPAKKIIKGYTIEASVEKQKDLLYAVVTNAARPATPGDGVQKINFRHALSQIEFKAKNQNKNIYVEITGVKLVNVFNKGDFEFPAGSTDPNYEGPETAVDPEDNPHTGPATKVDIVNHGTWTVATDSKATYTIETKAMPTDNANATVEVLGNNTEVSLTVTDKTDAEYNSQTLYVMPYDFSTASDAYKPWNGYGKPLEAKNSDSDATGNHAYLALKCTIWNVAKGDGSKDTNIKLWDGTTNYIAVKMEQGTKWEPGKRYVYTFVFTEKGNGGIDPNGNEVLTPIKLDITIDDFVDGDADKDINMVK